MFAGCGAFLVAVFALLLWSMIYSSDSQPTSHTVLAADDTPADRIDRFLTVHLATPALPLSRSRIKALILAWTLVLERGEVSHNDLVSCQRAICHSLIAG